MESYLLQVNVGESDAGILLSLDARLRSFEEQARTARDEIAVTQAKIASLETELARPWPPSGSCTAIEGLSGPSQVFFLELHHCLDQLSLNFAAGPRFQVLLFFLSETR